MNDNLMNKFFSYFEALHQCQRFFLQKNNINPDTFNTENMNKKELERLNIKYRKFIDSNNGVWGTITAINTLK